MTLVDILINWHCMLKCQKQSYFKRIKISNQRQQKQKFCCSFTYLANAFYDKSSFYKIIGDMFRRQWFKKTEFVVKSCNLYTKLDCRNDWKKKTSQRYKCSIWYTYSGDYNVSLHKRVEQGRYHQANVIL